MKTAPALALVALLLTGPLGAQDRGQPPEPSPAPTLRVIGLEECVASALGKGEDALMAAKTLDAARAAHAINLAKDDWTLAGSGAYTLGEGFSLGGVDLSRSPGSTLLGKAGGSYADLSSAIQASLSLSTGNASTASPGTKMTLTATETLPPSTSTSKPTTLVGFSLAQNVWDGYPGGQTRAVVEKSALTLTTKELQAALSQSTIRTNVQKAYLTMLSAQRALALKQGIADKQKALLNQIQAIFAIKQASSIDLQTATINSLTADLDVETARHDLALASQRLANLVGLPPDTPFSVSELPDDGLPAASLEEAIATGLAKRLEIAVADLNGRSSRIDLVVARGLGLPTLSLSGSLTIAGADSNDAEYASLGVKLNFPVLDAGSADAQERQARNLADNYATQKQQLQKTISADIRDAWWMATILRQKIDLASQGKDLSEAQLALVKAQNSYGTATNQDLLTASVNAANAATALATARYTYLLAVLTLRTAMGL